LIHPLDLEASPCLFSARARVRCAMCDVCCVMCDTLHAPPRSPTWGTKQCVDHSIVFACLTPLYCCHVTWQGMAGVGVSDAAVVQQLYSVFDTDGDGRISFGEVIVGMSTMQKVRPRGGEGGGCHEAQMPHQPKLCVCAKAYVCVGVLTPCSRNGPGVHR
jgi:hypothetical protein